MKTPADRLALAHAGLPFIASFCGRQVCHGLMPDFNLWTLRVTLSPRFVAGSTVAEETLLNWLTTDYTPSPVQN